MYAEIILIPLKQYMHKIRTFRTHHLNFLQITGMLAVVILVNGVEFHGHFLLAFNPNTVY